MTSTPPPTAAAVADQFGRTAKRLGRAFDEALAAHGVTTPRARVLGHVATSGPLRLNAVATEVGISQGTASELVEALVRDGFLTRAADPTDRRATLLSATDRGAASAAEWRRRYEQAAADLVAPLDDDERRTLVALLVKLDRG